MDEEIQGEAQPAPGERFEASSSIKWVAPRQIEAGELLMPLLLKGAIAKELAEFSLIDSDLASAMECFASAMRSGIPDGASIQSRALLFAGVVAYARPFKSGVRMRLDIGTIANAGIERDIHEYLLALRDKHVAHPVNAFEQANPVGWVGARPGEPWKLAGGVGVNLQSHIGLSAVQVQRAVVHIQAVRDGVRRLVEEKEVLAYQEFATSFRDGDQFEQAPLMSLIDRNLVAKRRQ